MGSDRGLNIGLLGELLRACSCGSCVNYGLERERERKGKVVVNISRVCDSLQRCKTKKSSIEYEVNVKATYTLICLLIFE